MVQAVSFDTNAWCAKNQAGMELSQPVRVKFSRQAGSKCKRKRNPFKMGTLEGDGSTSEPERPVNTDDGAIKNES